MFVLRIMNVWIQFGLYTYYSLKDGSENHIWTKQKLGNMAYAKYQEWVQPKHAVL